MVRGYGVLVILAVFLLAVGVSTEARAYLYDTQYGWPGHPNRVDDCIDSLYALNPTDTVDVIVDFCSTPLPSDSAFLATYGRVWEVFFPIGAIALRDVLISDCYLIAGYSRVKLVEWDESLHVHLDISARAIKARGSTTYPYPAQAAWDLNPTRGITGAGVRVSIIDSGVDDAHPALAGKFVAGYDAFTQTGGPGVNPDDDWVNWYHGTAVAGIVMGNDPAQQYMGVAPGARLIDCKIFNSTGQSQASYAVSAMLWCATNRSNYGIDVMCMAFGGRPSDGTDAMSRAADVAAQAGIAPVASAGNAPPLVGIDGPGAGNNVITVSAINDNGTVARADDAWDPVSQMGPRATPPPYVFGFNDLKPEVSAYAHFITTCRGSNPGQGGAGFWQHPGITGTSFATAHVAGVCALLLEKYPGTPPAQLDNQLRTTAEARGGPSFPLVDPVYNTQYGWGIVDAAKGININPPVDVCLLPWASGNWTTKSIWAGHYPLKVGDPNTLNARVFAIGGAAPGVNVTFEVMQAGWGGPWSVVGSTVITIPYNGSATATIPFTPTPQQAGHKCVRVKATYANDPNPANNSAQENMDVVPGQGYLAAAYSPGAEQRYVFPLEICVEAAPMGYRTADACICKKDLPPGADAWIEPPLPQEVLAGNCLPCSLIVQAPEGVEFGEGNAVYVNGWFWGNTIAEGGVTIYFTSAPPMDATISEIQYTDDPAGNSPLAGQRVRVSGIATVAEGVYPGRYCIQDGIGPWSGLFVEASGMGAQRGDSITLVGTVEETDGLTEIGAVSEFTLNSHANPVPEPTLVTPGVVNMSEAYEGVLVKVDSVTVTLAPPPPADWQVSNDGSCWVGRWASYGYVPVLGCVLDVTGIVGYSDGSYELQIRDDIDVEDRASGVGPDERQGLPKELALSQNRPNPFGPATEIRYALPRDCHVLLTVYSVSGRVVRTLLDAERPAGNWRVVWDGTDSAGARVSSGVYFCSIKAEGKTISRRMVYVK